MKHWHAAFAVLIAAAGAASPCLAQAGPGAAAPTEQLDPERLALANQVIGLSFPPENRRAMLARASDTMIAQARAAMAEAGGGALDAGMERIFQRFIDRMRALTDRVTAEHMDSIFSSLARAYARQFTGDELVQIRAFVSTPAGQQYVRRSLDMLSDPDVARANTAYMRSAFSAMQPLMADARRELDEYLQSQRPRP
jgi:hypothetical protein